MEPKVERTLSFFEKQGDAFIGEYPLIGIDLPALQKLFGVDLGDPMYDVWPVGPNEAAVLRHHVDGPIDLSKYDYFVECSAVSEIPARSGPAV
jgi:hypothetical protein